MKINPKIDALQLMLTDLRTRNEPIRHKAAFKGCQPCLLYTSPSPRDTAISRMPSSA